MEYKLSIKLYVSGPQSFLILPIPPIISRIIHHNLFNPLLNSFIPILREIHALLSNLPVFEDILIFLGYHLVVVIREVVLILELFVFDVLLIAVMFGFCIWKHIL